MTTFRSIVTVFFISVLLFSSCKKGRDYPYKIAVSDCDAPFSYRDSNGALTGIEIDIVRQIAADHNILVDLVPVPFNERMEELKKKKPSFDGAVGFITWTLARGAEYTFARPAYFISSMSLFTRNDYIGIKDFTDLPGHVVGVREHSLEYDFLKYQSDSLGHFDIVTYDSVESGLSLLENKSVDVIYEETLMVKFRMDRYSGIKLVYEGVKNQAISMVVKSDDSGRLLSKVNSSLSNMSEDGRTANIIRKYVK